MKKVFLSILAVLFAGTVYGSITEGQTSQAVAIQKPVITDPIYVAPPKVTSSPKTIERTAPPSERIPTYAPNGTYRNVDGDDVPSPYYADLVPAGATAQCGDGTYSFSQNHRGTCSHHGGVAEWLD